MFTSAFLRTLMLLGTQNGTLCQMQSIKVKVYIPSEMLFNAYYIILAGVN